MNNVNRDEPKPNAGKPDLNNENIVLNEKVSVPSSENLVFDFELARFEQLKGEISSTGPIDIYFLDQANYNKWSKGGCYFESKDSKKGILKSPIYEMAPSMGTWYLIIENNNNEEVTIEVLLRVTA